MKRKTQKRFVLQQNTWIGKKDSDCKDFLLLSFQRNTLIAKKYFDCRQRYILKSNIEEEYFGFSQIVGLERTTLIAKRSKNTLIEEQTWHPAIDFDFSKHKLARSKNSFFSRKDNFLVIFRPLWCVLELVFEPVFEQAF